MGYAFITRRGSLDELAIRTITVSSATELPTTERENTIAVISEIPSTTCFVCGNEPTDMKNGDFWITREDIVFSIITIEGDTTMGDILKYEQIVYSALTAIYIIIMNIICSVNTKGL